MNKMAIINIDINIITIFHNTTILFAMRMEINVSKFTNPFCLVGQFGRIVFWISVIYFLFHAGQTFFHILRFSFDDFCCFIRVNIKPHNLNKQMCKYLHLLHVCSAHRQTNERTNQPTQASTHARTRSSLIRFHTQTAMHFRFGQQKFFCKFNAF